MLKEAAAGSQLNWSQIWSCQQSRVSALLRCFRTRVVLVVRGLLLLLKLLALAPSPLPLEQFQHLPIPLQQLLAGCRLLCPHTPWTTQTLQAAYQGITPFPTVTSGDTCLQYCNGMRLQLAGVSNDSPWSLPRVNWALPAFKECHKAQLFPPSMEKSLVLLITLSLCWFVTENVINPLLLRHLRSLILHCHGKNIFGK